MTGLIKIKFRNSLNEGNDRGKIEFLSLFLYNKVQNTYSILFILILLFYLYSCIVNKV